MFLAFGTVCALLEAKVSGQGQVVDASMLDGTAAMSALIWAMRARGLHQDERGTNLLDTGAPFYDVYSCADGNFISVGAIEPKFYERLCELTGFEQDLPLNQRAPQMDVDTWPERKRLMTALIATRTRQQWCDLLEHTDACFAPVLSWTEATHHAHNVARETFVEVDGVTQPAPAPRFSRTPGRLGLPACRSGEHTDEILAEVGYAAADIEALRTAAAVL
jgi:alpha-methylacyl-CoA racemase